MQAKDTVPQRFYRIINANEHPGVYYLRSENDVVLESRRSLRQRLTELSAKEMRELAVLDAGCVGGGVALVRRTRYLSHCCQRKVERGSWVLLPLDTPMEETEG
jgi:hypothetical protein